MSAVLQGKGTRSILSKQARVFVHGIHKGSHMFRVHVRVKSMAQVGNVALWPKVIQHLLHQLPNLLLGGPTGHWLQGGQHASVLPVCNSDTHGGTQYYCHSKNYWIPSMDQALRRAK